VCIEATRLTVTKADYGIQFVVVTRAARVLAAAVTIKLST